MNNLEIIHENKDYIVINKMTGRISEKSEYEDNTVEDQVFNHLLKTNPKPYVGVIHRLDRVTSGVLIYAKKKSILVEFNELFSRRKVQKTYLAIVTERPPKDNGNLINFLVKNNIEKKADIAHEKSKNAVKCQLSYRILNQNDMGYLLEIKPTTGRFHQIRAQLANIELPILGDDKYGSFVKYYPLSICLHSWKLSYQVAGSTEFITFEAALPENDFWRFKTI